MIALIQDLEVVGLLHAPEPIQHQLLTTGARHQLRLVLHGQQVPMQFPGPMLHQLRMIGELHRPRLVLRGLQVLMQFPGPMQHQLLTTGERHRPPPALHGLQVLMQLLEEAAELRLVPANQIMTFRELLLTFGLLLLGKVAVTDRDQVDRLPLRPRQPILGM